jgi:hypothetical protein
MIAKGIVRRFEIRSNTPKAFANFSPAVGAQRQPWEHAFIFKLNAEGVSEFVRTSCAHCKQGLTLPDAVAGVVGQTFGVG